MPVSNVFLGLTADEWEQGDLLPDYSPMVGGPVTVEDVKAGIVAMLRRLDEEGAYRFTQVGWWMPDEDDADGYELVAHGPSNTTHVDHDKCVPLYKREDD